MTFRFFDFLGDVSGWRPRCLDALEELAIVSQQRDQWKHKAQQLGVALADAKEKIRQLELLADRPAPPTLTYTAERNNAWMQQTIESMGLNMKRLVLDSLYYMTNQSNMLNIIAWDYTDTLQYVKERFDCENFAVLFKAISDLHFRVNQVGIVLDYESGHGYNLIVYPDGNIQVLEPQHDNVYLWTKRPEVFYPLRGAYVAL